jgi:hypothetical protein
VGRQISSTSVFNNPSILLKVFSGSDSDKVQCILARSNQFVHDVQLLSYCCIRVWCAMSVIADIKSGKLSADIDAIVANMNPVTFGS